MQILKARFRTSDEFLAAYSDHAPEGTLFVPTTTPLEAGSEVVVELNCDGLPNRVLIRGKVQAWRPALPRLRVRAGATIAFNADERDKREFVVGAMGGGKVANVPKRKFTRIPVVVPVHFRRLDKPGIFEGRLVEISIGGCLLRAPKPPPIGTNLVVTFTPPGAAASIDIEGKVTYHGADGGLGVKFSFRDGGGARRLRELIRRIRLS